MMRPRPAYDENDIKERCVFTPKSPRYVSNPGGDWHQVPVISRASRGETGGSRREQGHQKIYLQPRRSTVIVALLVIAGSLFLIIQYVSFMGLAAIGGGLRSGESGVVASGLPSTAIGDDTKRLGVIVPVFAADLSKALNSLTYWPVTCYQLTLRRMDFILYYAGGAEDKVSERFLPRLAETGGRCFARTRIVLGNLTDEHIVSTIYNYDGCTLVANPACGLLNKGSNTFRKLYQAAFGGVEPFWIKGSTLGGVNFHETVMLSESRFMLGHINGNALYNNSDPAFVEFIEYTLRRWDYAYPYDVALWATIADLPYSWPLWQRYSRKFVVTDLISNVGSLDVSNRILGKAVESDTLFIYGSLTSGKGSMYKARATSDTSCALELLGRGMPSDKCTRSCGSLASIPSGGWMATVCDRSCSPGEHGPRFGGLNCGAGDAKRFGENCRMCYEDLVEAKKAEEQLAERNALRDVSLAQEHVIICETLLPPPTLACSSKCMRKVDTVCDESCGRGRYNSYNCNWRGYGYNCRFCFHDREAALKADTVAKKRGGRVIMCHTYEPPMEEDVWTALPSHSKGAAKGENGDRASEGEEAAISEHEDVEQGPLTPDKEIYVRDIKRGQLCAFMIGRQRYLSETHVAAKSIAHFMPGMRIAIATPPDDVSVHERTLGYLPGVRVTPALEHAELAALLADQHCGNGTRLVYYLNPGEMLSRTFTSKDTHSVTGDLLVVFTEVDRVGGGSLARTLTTTSVLGFSSPSFSFGVDIMLPVEINQQLRDVLLSDPNVGLIGSSDVNPHVHAIRAIGGFKNAFIPEVLAALAYSRNLPGVWFINPQQWVTYHMFEPASIWNIPLVKPRFGCAFDISMVNRGYDVARELEQRLEHFIRGGTCAKGFIHLDKEALRPRAYIEYGLPTGRAMPTIEDLTVSVVFNVEANVQPISLEVSLTSVVERFPDAVEAVIIFNESPMFEEQVMEVIEAHDKRANFHVFAAKTMASKERHSGDDWNWSGLHTDEYCSGRFVLNMEPGDVLMTKIAYNNIFHFRKPVIPFDRLTKRSTDKPNPVDQCIMEAVTVALGKHTVHNFALLRSLAYPREAYKNLRRFLEKGHSTDIDTVVNHGRTSCKKMKAIGKDEPLLLVPRARYERSLLGAFMWHNMHNAVHWRALNTLDIQADEWPTEVRNYNLYCDLRSFGTPEDDNTARDFVEVASQIDSPTACTSFKKIMDVGV